MPANGSTVCIKSPIELLLSIDPDPADPAFYRVGFKPIPLSAKQPPAGGQDVHSRGWVHFFRAGAPAIDAQSRFIGTGQAGKESPEKCIAHERACLLSHVRPKQPGGCHWALVGKNVKRQFFRHAEPVS